MLNPLGFPDFGAALWFLGLLLALTVSRWIVFWRGQFADVAGAIPERVDVDAFINDKETAAKDNEMPSFLLEREVELYGHIDANLKDLDGKASTLLGFLGGGIGLYALISEGKVLDVPRPTAFLYLAIVLLFLALISAILCVAWRRRRGMPKLRGWTEVQIVSKEQATKARLALYSAMLYIDRNWRVRQINIEKAFWLEQTQILFAAGAAALLLNYCVVVSSAKNSTGTKLHCYGAWRTRLQASSVIDCTITKGE